MKRFFACLCTCIIVFAMTACGQSEPQTTAEAKQENIIDKDQMLVDEQLNDKEKSNIPEISFEGMVVVDNEDCTIKITEIDAENMWGYTLKVFLENKTTDKTLMYSAISASINGVECDPFFASEVAAGKKSNEEITFMTDPLAETDLNLYTDVELKFRVYDSNNWGADDIVQTSIHVYPYGEEYAVKYIRPEQPKDIVLMDNEYAKIIATGYEWDDIWGYSVRLYIENKSDTSIMVSTDEVSVNGYMVDPFYAKSVSAGNCSFSSMSWLKDNLEKNGITEIENIEFKLRVYDENNWMASDFFNEVITLTP